MRFRKALRLEAFMNSEEHDQLEALDLKIQLHKDDPKEIVSLYCIDCIYENDKLENTSILYSGDASYYINMKLHHLEKTIEG